MRRVEIQLKPEERSELERLSGGGVIQVRPLQRAQILLALDKGIKDGVIASVLNVERTRIWRVRQRYLQDGLQCAIADQARSGRPVEYGDQAAAEIVALACSAPPEGQSHWSLPMLTAVARQQTACLASVSQETVRQTLKKNAVSLG
jgi:Homeodomain-like domain